ncbi:nuclear transport factor 2-like [Zingiber officinale]|uniref:nuclear transport factor 2-like n=1 Tax=Zingiber officinale TaxID=94328 RepID=UPI001C4D2098|nr:nuclear transport factor 2-like [Zingiber officinale]
MALPTTSPVPSPSPQVIGNAFVQQYYHILHQSPEIVFKFYQDSSMVNRLNSDGQMISLTTLQAINEKIMSLDFRNCFTEIETVDSQISFQSGLLIVVTGSFTGQDNIRKKFAQSFFLAPQEVGGYFVLNDVFRFLNETQPRELNHIWAGATNDDVPKTSTSPETDFSTQENHVPESPLFEEDTGDQEVVDQSEDQGSGAEDGIVVDPPANVDESNSQQVFEVFTLGAQDDTPKKSYASIVKVMKGSPSPVPIHATPGAKVAPANTEKPVAAPASAPVHPTETSNPYGNDDAEKSNIIEEEGHSIYIRNLPLNATAEQVEEEFKKFGAIKPSGVQVRSHKVERYCFGFVEFSSLKSMQAAIEASPIMIGGRHAIIEEKRTTTRVVNGVVTNIGNVNNGRGRYQSGRGAFRNDNFRGRGAGGFGPTLGYRRNDFRNRVEYSGRGRGSSRRTDDYQQRSFYNNGNGTMGGVKSPKPSAVSA